MENPYFEFEEKGKFFLEESKKDLNGRIQKARNKIAALNNYTKTVLDVEYYQLQRKLGNNSRFLIDIAEILELDEDKEISVEFNLKLQSLIVENKSEFLFDLAKYKAADEMYIYCHRKSQELKPVKSESNEAAQKQGDLNWLKNNETEFVQFVYALHYAGYISNQDNTVTKLVAQMAKAFNLQLGNNWQSNFSKSINERNADYLPNIFANIQQGFTKYRDSQINKQK
jgi:RteC protein